MQCNVMYCNIQRAAEPRTRHRALHDSVGAQGPGPGTRDLGPRTRDLGPGTGTRDLGPLGGGHPRARHPVAGIVRPPKSRFFKTNHTPQTTHHTPMTHSRRRAKHGGG